MGRTYLFSRANWNLPNEDPVELAYQVFFQLWAKRQHPYRVFSESDTVFIANQTSRVVEWEVKVGKVLTLQYKSTRHALAALRAAYGMYSDDLNDYHRTRSGAGFLLAWAPIPTRRLAAPLPPGQPLGRNGYRELMPTDLRDIGLPVRRRHVPLAQPPSWFEPTRATTGLTTPVSRYIQAEVRRQVWERDAGRCVGCGTQRNLHFDHIEPFLRGGLSTSENLRLLCAPSNLAKGSSDTVVPKCSV